MLKFNKIVTQSVIIVMREKMRRQFHKHYNTRSMCAAADMNEYTSIL